MGAKAPKLPTPVQAPAPQKVEGPQTPPEVNALIEVGRKLLSGGAPLRETMLRDVLAAWTGGVLPAGLTPLGARRRSDITAEGGRTREAARARLESQGLLNSSYGNQALTGIDREIANMLVSSDTRELERLLGMAPALSEAGVAPGLSAMGAGTGELTKLALGTSAASAQNAENAMRVSLANTAAQNQVAQQNALAQGQASANKSQMLAGIGTTVGMAGLGAATGGLGFLPMLGAGASGAVGGGLFGAMSGLGGSNFMNLFGRPTRAPQIGTGGELISLG